MATANDNRDAAGVLKDGVLTLRLVAEEARWRPEGESAADPTRTIQAFAEEGKAPQIPGPLVRVPEGTEIRMSVRNAIPGPPMRLYGAMTRPGDSDAFVEIASGTTRDLRFTAGKPGTYAYLGGTGVSCARVPVRQRGGPLVGALIVDPASGREGARRSHLRVAMYPGVPDPSGNLTASLTINGRSLGRTPNGRCCPSGARRRGASSTRRRISTRCISTGRSTPSRALARTHVTRSTTTTAGGWSRPRRWIQARR
jgi:hypothetical protein